MKKSFSWKCDEPHHRFFALIPLVAGGPKIVDSRLNRFFLPGIVPLCFLTYFIFKFMYQINAGNSFNSKYWKESLGKCHKSVPMTYSIFWKTFKLHFVHKNFRLYLMLRIKIIALLMSWTNAFLIEVLQWQVREVAMHIFQNSLKNVVDAGTESDSTGIDFGGESLIFHSISAQ